MRSACDSEQPTTVTHGQAFLQLRPYRSPDGTASQADSPGRQDRGNGGRPGSRNVGGLPRTRRRSIHASRNLSRAPSASLVIGYADPGQNPPAVRSGSSRIRGRGLDRGGWAAVRSACDTEQQFTVTDGASRSTGDSDDEYITSHLAAQALVEWWSGTGSNCRPSAFQAGSFALLGPERDYRYAAELGACVSDEPIGTVVGRAPGNNPIQTRTSADENGSRSSYFIFHLPGPIRAAEGTE